MKKNYTIYALLILFTASICRGQFNIVKDIYQGGGSTSSNPMGLVKFKNRFLFIATEPTTGTEIYISDGTDPGTILLKDINPGAASSVSTSMINTFGIQVAGNVAYFAADDGVHGQELWITDGTTTGTHIVKDILPGTATPSLQFIDAQYSVGLTDSTSSLIFFYAHTDTYSMLFYRSDGTAAGTYKLSSVDNYWGTSMMSRGTVFKYNGMYYFPNFTDLYQSNGTDTLTLTKSNIGQIRRTLIFNNQLFYTVDTSPLGSANKNCNLSVTTNGFATSTVVKTFSNAYDPYDIGPYSALYPIGNKFYFSANMIAYNNQSGGDIWVSDGTTTGTQLVKNYMAYYTLGTRPVIMGGYNGKLYFIAYTGNIYGKELCQTDGTPSGTNVLKDIAPAASSSDIETMVIYQDSLFFLADGVLWKSFGVDSNTVQVTNKTVGCFSYSLGTEYFLNSGDTLLLFTGCFQRSPLNTESELYKYGPASISGIKNITEKENIFSVYPNPATNVITILSSEELSAITICNSLGEIILQAGSKTTKEQIDISELKPGIYFINYKTGNIQQNKKFIKQ